MCSQSYWHTKTNKLHKVNTVFGNSSFKVCWGQHLICPTESASWRSSSFNSYAADPRLVVNARLFSSDWNTTWCPQATSGSQQRGFHPSKSSQRPKRRFKCFDVMQLNFRGKLGISCLRPWNAAHDPWSQNGKDCRYVRFRRRGLIWVVCFLLKNLILNPRFLFCPTTRWMKGSRGHERLDSKKLWVWASHQHMALPCWCFM